jgi:hypothetical protein
MSDVKTQEVLRRPRGRPRKNPDFAVHDQKKRGSQTSHGPEHYAEIRHRRSLAGIMHKQFRILVEDEAEAERLMSKLLDKANAAYHDVSVRERQKIEDEEKKGKSWSPADLERMARSQKPADADPMEEIMDLPQEPPTASLLEEKQEPPPEPADKRKPIRERGKLTLKAFRKETP